MYSTFQLAKKYLRYYFLASNGRGHGIHSPFVFDFIIHVLNDKNKYECYPAIEKLRQKLLKNGKIIKVDDFGAGSTVVNGKSRAIKDIARSSLKNEKFAQLLYRVVKYYKPKTIVELGTSFGITTSYLAMPNPKSVVFSLEGSENIAAIAMNNFKDLGLSNIELIKGNFDQTLSIVLQKTGAIDLAFIDGNHQKDSTLRYFKLLSENIIPSSVLIFDDIHWSKQMEEAWTMIKEHSSVKLSIDLFFVGLIFFSGDFKAKQHFIIRY